MKIATQSDLDQFKASVLLDESIYPYLSLTKYSGEWAEQKNDWERQYITNENLSYLIALSFTRTSDLEISIALYAKNTIAAAYAIMAIKELLKRYKPFAVNSVVHASNRKSIALHKKVFGEPWGIEKLGAWNSLLGEYEDSHHFRFLCQK